MPESEVDWLNHLKEAVPPEGYGNKLSMYLIALEAWRRGIKVNFFTVENPDNKILVRYSLEYNGKIHHFESSLGDKLSKEAFDVCEYKDLTKRYMEDAGIKVPRGKVFSTKADDKEVLDYAKTISFPVVVKPLDENAGKGVFADINSEDYLLEIIDYLRKEMNYTHVVIEEFIPGDEYRILTIDGKVHGAVNRKPANIIGNGKENIESLIKKKNESKAGNPAISKKRIKLDKEVLQNIERNNYTLETILKKDEQLFLRGKSNISAGGDPIDITDELSEKIKTTAEKASRVIPGLNIAGLDFIINSETGEPTIIEINTKPMIGLHLFPVQGQARDVVKPIIDLYFPETKNIERSNLCFDFSSKIAPLDNLTVTEVELNPLANIKIHHTREFIINMRESENSLAKTVRIEALKSRIHGYIKKLKTHQYQVVVASESEQAINNFKKIFSLEGITFNISKVDEREWNKPVNTGFVIKRETDNDLKERLKKEDKRYKNLLMELKKVEEQTEKLTEDLENERVERAREQQENRELKEKISGLLEQIETLKDENISLTLKVGETERTLISQENKLSKRIESLESNYEDLWKKYKGTVNSKSWKVTKPLRKFNPYNKKK
jgi:D-alanine-D-alanine ligase-like ATP-grasp enzyme/acylphosphatase